MKIDYILSFFGFILFSIFIVACSDTSNGNESSTTAEQPCLNCSDAPKGTIFCDDFESPQPLQDRYFEYNSRDGSFVREEGVGVGGTAGTYTDYPFAIRLKNANHDVVLLTEADIRTWLPGDILHDETLFIPADMPSGEYDLQVGLVERSADKIPQPQIKLAIEGITPEGWYSMGKITVQ